jgi:hypothetical protein
LMHSSDINISFKAVRIFSFLCSDGKNSWSNTSIDYNTVTNEIVSSFWFKEKILS